MSTYKFKGPDGKTYRFKGPDLTPAAAPVASDATPTPKPPTARTDFSDQEVNFPKEVAKIAIKTPLEAMGKAAQGLRGIGVGTQRLIQGEGGMALDRAAAATEPGYKPIKGERIGAIAGPALPLLAVGNIPAAAALAGGVGAGEKLNEGADLKEAGKQGAFDAGLTVATAGVFKGAGAGGKALFRNFLAKGKGLTREAVDFVMDNPEVKRAVGSNESVGKAIDALKGTINEAKKVAGEKIGAMRKSLGLKSSLQEAEERILNDVAPRPIKNIVQDVNAATELSKTGKFQKGDLDMLIKLKEEIRELQKFSVKDPKLALRDVDDALLSQKVTELDNMIEAVPEGRKLAALQQEYSDILSEFKDFAQKLNTPGEAEQALQQIAAKGEGLTGKLKNMVEAIKSVEAKTKAKTMMTAMAEAGKRLYDTSQGEGILGAAVEGLEKTIGPKAVKAVAGLPSVFDFARPIVRATASPLVNALTGKSNKKKEK